MNYTESFLPFPPSEVKKKNQHPTLFAYRNSSLRTSPLMGKRRKLFFAVGQPLDEKKVLVARFKASSACHALAFKTQSALQRLTLLELTDFSALVKMLFDPSAHILQPFSPAAPNASYLTLPFTHTSSKFVLLLFHLSRASAERNNHRNLQRSAPDLPGESKKTAFSPCTASALRDAGQAMLGNLAV